MRSTISASSVVIASVVVALAFGTSARSQEPTRPDVTNELLVEMRALRRALEQTVSANARVQLAMGRLQIQEQRVSASTRQLHELRQTLAGMERQTIEREAQLADLEGVLPGTTDSAERQAITQEAGQLRAMLAAGASGLQKLRVDEGELANLVSAEQGRLAALNQQLDAIDQAMRPQ